jgi:GMP synthase (glutamine-hydrolysing)
VIYLINNTIDGQGASPGEIRAALQQVDPDLDVLMESFSEVSLQRVASLNPSHIILSGQSHPWERYSPESLAGVFSVIREAKQPILGVCGGHQQMALAFGAPVGLMGRLEPGEGYEGAKRERGFFEVETNARGIFRDLPDKITVWHSHFDEVKILPPNFVATAANGTCLIQAMEHDDRPLFGVQFHPELFDEAHPDGRRVLENFLNL